MKRYAAILLICALLLSACGRKEPETVPTVPAELPGSTEPTAATVPQPQLDPDAFCFTRDSFPVMDGSTSLVPLGEGIASALLGMSRKDASELIRFNRTTQSFRNLREGKCDLVIAAEPKSTVFEEMDAAGFAYEIESIAREALVFVVNENNPVSSLTRQQVRDIYSGKVTNWSQVGGADLPIEAFQRNSAAGSQVMMEKLVMGGTPMMEAPESRVPGEMGQLIDAVKSFDDSANAIGYTVFYYASDMQMARGLKILKIDDILPEPRTMQNGSYPFLNGYYCCISKNTPEDAPARRLYNWLVSEMGQSLLSWEGYVPVYASGQAPLSGRDVYVDFSKYTPNGGSAAVFSILPGGTPEELVPSADYGQIFPYYGTLQYTDYGMEGEEYLVGGLKGFFSEKGTVLCKPVYADIFRIPYDWNTPGSDYVWAACLANGEEAIRYRLISRDGSFVSEKEYSSISAMGKYMMGSNYDTGAFDIYDTDFRICMTEKDFVMNGMPLEPMNYANGIFSCCHWNGNNSEYYLVDEDGRVRSVAWNYIELYEDGTIGYIDYNSTERVEYRGRNILFDGDLWVRYMSRINDQFYAAHRLDDRLVIVDRMSNLFQWDLQDYNFMNGGNFSVKKDGKTYIYDPNGRELFGGPIEGDWEFLDVGGLICERRDGVIIRDLNRPGWSLEPEDAAYAYKLNDDLVYIGCVYQEGVPEGCYLLDRSGNLKKCDNTQVFVTIDSITGAKHLVFAAPYGFGEEKRLFTADGTRELFRGNGSVEVMNGWITLTNDWAFTAYNPDGAVAFCYPFYGLAAGD